MTALSAQELLHTVRNITFETLPSGDTATVYLCPHPTRCDVVAHWNGQACLAETCVSVAEAERLAMEWWVELYSPTEEAGATARASE